MTTYTPHDEWLGGRYVGQSVTRREDAALVTGSACFVDDLAVPQMLHAAFARSEVARGRIVGLDTAAALATDGAVAVLTAADVEPHRRGPMSPTLYLDARGAPLQPLASEDVRFVGDPVAITLGTSRYAAADAAELVRLDVEAEPPVLDDESALSSGALVHP
jgi:carbon-monoxide dehydrogenase large subunit